MQAQRYTNGILTAIAALLGLHVVGQAMHRGATLAPEASMAQATQPEQYRRDGAAGVVGGAERTTGARADATEGGLVSAAEQRKTMIMELRNLGARMAAIENRLSGPLDVNVMTMPAGSSGNSGSSGNAGASAPAEPAPQAAAPAAGQ